MAFRCFAFVNLFFFDRLYLPVLLGFEVGEKSMQAEHSLSRKCSINPPASIHSHPWAGAYLCKELLDVPLVSECV